MKLAIGIPTRNRPLDLVASILSLDKTRSRAGVEVRYIVGIDNDDRRSLGVFEALQDRIGADTLHVTIGARPLGLGEINNRLVAAADEDATFLLWTDRAVIITENWDYLVADAAQQFPNRLLWLDSIHLQGPAQTILPPAWRAALPGAPYVGTAPFWFDDSGLEEIDAFCNGFPRIAVSAKCAGPRTEKTNRCRDVAFWIKVFEATRGQRVAQAAQLRQNLGHAPRDPAGEIALFEERGKAFLASAPELERQYSSGAPPDELYKKAKLRAEMILSELGIAP